MSYTMRFRREARYSRRRRWPKRLMMVFIALLLFVSGGALYTRHVYYSSLEPVSPGNQLVKTITVERGASLDEITGSLKEAGLIRNEWVFKLYVSRKDASNSLQAGTYSFSPGQGVDEIVTQLTHGKVVTDLVRILPGLHINQIRETLINYGFSEDDVDEALVASSYGNHPALAGKPATAGLAGYIYPDSYQRDSSTTPRQIIKRALDEMAEKLTPGIRGGFAKQGLSVHEAVILASIVEREVSKPDDRAKVAQVFLKRLEIDMALQSDATKPYFDSYNNAGLPPFPISNVSITSLEAVADPANTDWLYFVSGDDGITHYSNTLQEHEANIIKYCTTLCGRR